MDTFRYNSISEAFNHHMYPRYHKASLVRSYDAHKRRLEEIRLGRDRPIVQRNRVIDPKLEESKMLTNRHRIMSRQFKECGTAIRCKHPPDRKTVRSAAGNTILPRSSW